MVELFVCFSSRTSFPFKVSRYTCGYSLIGFLHILYLDHHIIYLISFSHHIIYLCTFRLSSIFLFCGNLFYSNSLYICTLRTWTLYWDKCVIVTNWTSFVLCTIFVASFFFSWWCPVFFFSSNPPKKKIKGCNLLKAPTSKWLVLTTKLQFYFSDNHASSNLTKFISYILWRFCC